MREFYFTACPSGRRADDRRPTAGGYGARAVTEGLSGPVLDAAIRRAGCDFPTRPPRPPVGLLARLALLRGRDGGLVVYHSVPGGADEANRRGFPFTHALIELPDDCDAARVIRTWGSPGWKRADDDGPLDLEHEPAWPAPGPLSEAGLAEFLRDDANRAMTAYAIAALTAAAPRDQAKLYLYADPEYVAWVVFALTLALPAAARQELTFSTYETGVLDVPARVVATWADSRERDLPRDCYGPSCAAFNRESRRTGAASSALYADAAVDWLARGEAGRLAGFLALAEEFEATVGDALDDLLALESRHEALTPERLRRLLSRPSTAARVVAAPEVLERALAVATEQPTQAGDVLARVLEAAGRAGHRDALVARLEQAALDATRRDRPEALAPLLAALGHDGASRSRLAGTAVRSVDPAPLSWPTRAALLVLFRDALGHAASEPPAGLAAWLDVDAARLPALLDLELPATWQAWAWAGAALGSPLADASLVDRLARQPAQLAAAFRRVEALGGRAETQLAAALDRAPVRELLAGFEPGPVPDRVCDRVLGDRDLVRSLLVRPAVGRRLAACPERLAQIMAWAVDSGDARHLIQAAADGGVAPAAVARAAREVGWQALRDGRQRLAEFAWDAIVAKVEPGARLEIPPTLQIGAFRTECQEFLVRRAIQARDEAQLLAWMDGMAPTCLASLVTRADIPARIRTEAVRSFAARQRTLPGGAGKIAAPVDGLVDLIAWLGGRDRDAGTDLSRALAASLLEEQPARKVEIRDAVLARVEAEPALGSVAEALLAAWVAGSSGRASADLYRAAEAHLRRDGCTPAILALAERVLDAPPIDPAASGLLLGIEATDRPGAGSRRDLIALIHYRRAQERAGGDMTSWRDVLALIPFLGARARERGLAEQLALLARDLVLQPRARLLDQRLAELAETVVDSKAEAFRRLLDRVATTPELDAEFWGSPDTVAACFAVALGVPTALAARAAGPSAPPHPPQGRQTSARAPGPSGDGADSAMARLVPRLVDETFRRHHGAFFYYVARRAGDWPDGAFARWIQSCEEARNPAAAQSDPGKPGLFSRLLGGGKAAP